MQTKMQQIEQFMQSFPAEEMFPTHPQKEEIKQYLITNIQRNGINTNLPIEVNVLPDAFPIISGDGEFFESSLILYAGLVHMAISQSVENPFMLKFGIDLNGLRHYVDQADVMNFSEDEIIIEVWWQ